MDKRTPEIALPGAPSHPRVKEREVWTKISTGLLPSGTATGQLGTVDGTPLDFRRITRIKTGAEVEIYISADGQTLLN